MGTHLRGAGGLLQVLPLLRTSCLPQLVLLVGKLNTIAGIVTVFYLVAYAAVDLACLALEWASAPNFRWVQLPQREGKGTPGCGGVCGVQLCPGAPEGTGREGPCQPTLSFSLSPTPPHSPTFQLFSWHTCLLGIVSCLVMMFLISPAGASGSLGLMLLLLGFIHLRSAASSWGYISQALIFHQVRCRMWGRRWGAGAGSTSPKGP